MPESRVATGVTGIYIVSHCVTRGMGERTRDGPLGDRLPEEFVVDGDFHLHVPVGELYEYVDDEMIREKLERFGAPPRATSAWKLQYATETMEEGTGSHMRPHGIAVTAEEVAAVREDFGVDRTIVTPGTNLPFMGGARYPTVLNHLARAYNDYVVDTILNPEAGIYATFVLPVWDVEFALAEIDRVADEPGFVGAQSYFSNNTLFGSTEFDPLYAELSARGLPLVLHVGDAASRFDLVSDSQQTFAELGAVQLNHAALATVVNMVMTGVFDVYPDLDVVIQEAGVNWVPYLAYNADEYYQSSPEDVKLTPRLYERGQEYLERLPSEYVFDHVYLTTQPVAFPKRAREVEALLTACHAEEMFVFSTDWPHVTVDTPTWLFEHVRDDDVRARITHRNAEAAFRFPDHESAAASESTSGSESGSG